ncbi:hypothetical protein BCR35DRAFT_274611 [Leucosporidium creatinivorum]|uniref:Coenzyme Q-binding protein COQ10 START domain-containing protein n=1 Tax=Leucosporidium creatinivorum TaxID=106004 RepID=A0A1Y2G171_9BASI|nr:hypothetical protein BCR35DRAFT_274611 [Leucosporidium creatinivorum]
MSLAPAAARRSTRIAATAATGSRIQIPVRRHFFNLPSPFASSSSSSSSPSAAGTLTKRGSVYVYEESRNMPYTPQQLYSVIADVDAYSSFLPFATKSEVLSAVHEGQSRSVQEQGWLKGGQEGEVWQMEAELKIGAMGFEEGYVSKVEAKKWEKVSATAKDTTIFKHLTTSWALTPQPPSAGRPLTKVDLYLAYAFISPFHAAAVSAMWEKVSGMMIGGFEKRVGDVYGR